MALTKTVSYTQEIPQALGYSTEVNNTVLTGSIDPAAITLAVVGVGTLFTTELTSGDSILVNGETRIVDVITDNTNLTVTVAFSNTGNDTSPEVVLGTVTAKIQFNNKMGRLKVGAYGSSESFIYGNGTCAGLGNNWEISGTSTDVNAALDDLVWYPRTYDDAAIAQNHLSIDRTVTDHKGEVLVEVEDRGGNFSFAVGDDYAIYNGADYINFICTKVETTLSGKRIYGVLVDEYDLTSDPFTTVPMHTSQLVQLTPTLVIDNIVDYAIINPHGDSNLVIEILDGAVQHATGTTTLDGALFSPEPYFTTPPPTTIVGVGGDAWTVGTSFGEVAQANNEMITVQLLLKRDQNDPLFDGDVPTNKPSYITDESYGVFSIARVNDRQARCISDSGEVRWEFYGTPSQVNSALKYLQFYQVAPYKDFYIETRLITGRSRIYNNRGYN